MKRGVKTTISLASCALLGVSALAVTDPGDSPYKVIPDRNVFGLKPPPPPPNPEDLRPPPPKITLQGITTILGQKQVLFKVAMPARPPEPAKEVPMVLSEGERGGEVEVLAIDEVAGTIKFNNNGKEQTLSLEKDAVKPATGFVPPPIAGLPQAPMPIAAVPNPAPANPGGGGVTTIGGSTALRTIPTRPLRASPEGTAAVGAASAGTAASTATSAQVSPQSTTTGLDREANELVTHLEYLNAKQKGSPTAAMYPPDRSNPTRNVVAQPAATATTTPK